MRTTKRTSLLCLLSEATMITEPLTSMRVVWVLRFHNRVSSTTVPFVDKSWSIRIPSSFTNMRKWMLEMCFDVTSGLKSTSHFDGLRPKTKPKDRSWTEDDIRRAMSREDESMESNWNSSRWRICWYPLGWRDVASTASWAGWEPGCRIQMMSDTSWSCKPELWEPIRRGSEYGCVDSWVGFTSMMTDAW